MMGQKEKAGSRPAPSVDDVFRLSPSLACKAQEGSAHFGKLGGGAFIPRRRVQVLLTTDRHLPCREIYGDDLSHVFVSSVAALVERHPVSAT